MSKNVDWIGRTYTSDVGWELLCDLAEIGGRLGASEGERRGHERVMEAFESVGVRDVHDEPFEIPKWDRGAASLSLSEPTGRSFDGIALPGSPSGEVATEVSHLGHGLVSDFEGTNLEGKIAVARSDVPKHHDRWMHRREKYFRAYNRGAEAFVFQNHVPGCLPPTGSLGGSNEIIGPIPAIGVSKEVGDRIAMYAREGTVTGSLSVDVTVSDGESRNIVGILGPDTEKEVLVCAHVDGHDISEGALDNASGVAVLSEVARALAEREEELERRVRLVGFGSEEFGLIGSEHYASIHEMERIVAVVNCDGAGRGRDLVAKTCGFPGMRDAVEAVTGALRHPAQIVPGVNTHSDHWPFVQRGVPGVQIKSDTGDGRGFGHTFADTLDKTDVRAIRDHSVLVTRLVERLANGNPIASRDPEGIAEELRKNDLETPMRVAGDWPF